MELESSSTTNNSLFPVPSLKLACTVHGPRPLARSAAYSPHLALTCHIKFTPYASRNRRGYLRDPTERDLAAQLETALRGIILGERFPKSGVDVIITILEGDEDSWSWGSDETSSTRGWGSLGVLAGCVSVASAALVDAGIDILDVIVGGVAAIVSTEGNNTHSQSDDLESKGVIVLDPNPVEHDNIIAGCVVAYIASRDEMPLLWLKGSVSGPDAEKLIDAAVKSAQSTRRVVDDVIKAATKQKLLQSK